MSECDRVSDLFGEFHERRLDKQAETFVTKHLEGCPYCNNEYQWYGLTVQTLMSLDKVNPPDYLLQQIKAKLHETNQSESMLHVVRHFFTSSPYMPLPVGIGALIIIVFVGVVIYDRSPHEVFSSSAQSIAQTQTTASAPVQRMASSSETPWYKEQIQKDFPSRDLISKGFFGSQQGLSGHLQQYAMSSPRVMESNQSHRNMYVPLLRATDTGSLTLHSKSIPVAVDSLKRMLPSLDGNLIEEKTEGKVGEITLGVAIPYSAYSKLTSELVNFGALAGGADKATPPTETQRGLDTNKVVLYIRFIPSH